MTEIILKSNMARDKINALLLFLKTWDDKIQVSVYNDEPYSAEAEKKTISSKKKLSELAGTLSHETADAMQKYVAESRAEWEERLNRQF